MKHSEHIFGPRPRRFRRRGVLDAYLFRLIGFVPSSLTAENVQRTALRNLGARERKAGGLSVHDGNGNDPQKGKPHTQGSFESVFALFVSWVLNIVFGASLKLDMT